MAVSLTLESKSNASLTLENKGNATITWDDAIGTWDEQEGTWDLPRITLTKESKSSVDLSLKIK